MRVASLIFFLSLFFSCNYFDKDQLTTEEILNEELQTFNWHEVDEYPSFSSCDSVLGKTKKQNCFKSTLSNHINNRLSSEIIVVNDSIHDVVTLKLIIDNSGNVKIEEIRMKSSTSREIPQLDSLLRKSFDSLPKIYPAIKRSQQVTTQFVLPIELKIK